MSAADTLRLILLSMLWGMSFIFRRVAVPEFGPVPLILLIAGLMLWPTEPISGLAWTDRGH